MANSTADSSFSTYGLENELSGYKAVSGSAIFSAILGLFSGLMFVDWSFAFIPALAVVFGILALRNINRMPDFYTGQKIAQAGIGMGFLFSLLAVASSYAFEISLNSSAGGYAKSLADTMKTARAEDLLFLRIPPSQRGDLNPDKALAERLASSGPEGKLALDQEMKPLQDVAAAIKNAGGQITFNRLERVGYDKLTPFAVSIYTVPAATAPAAAHDHKPGEEHDHDHAAAPATGPQLLMMLLKAEKTDTGKKWYITEVVFPYKAGTAKIKEEKVDDGHGHAH